METEQIEFIVKKILNTSVEKDKILLRKVCETISSSNSQEKDIFPIDIFLSLPSFSFTDCSQLSEWAERYFEVLVIVQSVRHEYKGAWLSSLTTKWREGVVHLITQLLNIHDDCDVINTLEIGLCLMKLILKFVEKSHDESHDQVSDITCFQQQINDIFEKLRNDWLPWLSSNDTSLSLTSNLENIDIIRRWIDVMFEFTFKGLPIDSQLIHHILLILQNNVQELMKSVEESKDVSIFYKTVKILSTVYESFNILQCQVSMSKEKSSLLQISEWVWQCYESKVERIIMYHTHLCQSTLLHSQTNYQGKHVSFSIQMWHFYFHCLLNDITQSLLPPEAAVKIITLSLESTLQTLACYYADSPPPSLRETKQYQADVIAILLSVCTLLPFISDPLKKERTESIHKMCTSLFQSLTAYMIPLSLLTQTLQARPDHDDTNNSYRINWQEYLPLGDFDLNTYCQKDEQKQDIISVCLLPYSNNPLILKCILDKGFRSLMISMNPTLFTSLSSILVYLEPNHLLELFIQANIKMHQSSDDEDQLTKIALLWLKEHTMTPIINFLINSAVEYTVLSLKHEEHQAMSVVRSFFEKLPSFFDDIQISVILVLRHLAISCPKDVKKHFTSTQVLFGRFFENVLQFSEDLFPPLSMTHLFSHWNIFTLIIQHFFTPSSCYKSTLSADLLKKLNISHIAESISSLHKKLISERSDDQINNQFFMDSRLLEVTAESICYDEYGQKSFNTLWNWLKENKHEILSSLFEDKERSSPSSCVFPGGPFDDIVKACTHINNSKQFVHVFDVSINWESIIKDCLPLFNNHDFQQCVLKRWEMDNSADLSEEDKQYITQIKDSLIAL